MRFLSLMNVCGTCDQIFSNRSGIQKISLLVLRKATAESSVRFGHEQM